MVSALLLILIYLSFISLGLPDSMLGAAWPMMYGDIGALLGQAGIISMVTSAGTIISSLSFVHLKKRFGTGAITSFSIFLTAFSLFLFSSASSLWVLIPIALVLGLGGGCVDSALNNYVSAHYSTGAMSFLHGFWGLGTTIGPIVLGVIVPLGYTWRTGYKTLSGIQAIILLLSLLMFPLWKLNARKADGAEKTDEDKGVVGYREALQREGSVYALMAFFSYCATESTAMVWGASYMVQRGIGEATAATWASFFFWGMTAGRMLSGFIATKLGDWRMIRMGAFLLLPGLVLLPLMPKQYMYLSFFLLGLGCAPTYPMMIHETTRLYGEDATPALIGLQMATAYVGTTLMPALFGLLSSFTGMWVLPLYMGVLHLLTIYATEQKAALLKKRNLLIAG